MGAFCVRTAGRRCRRNCKAARNTCGGLYFHTYQNGTGLRSHDRCGDSTRCSKTTSRSQEASDRRSDCDMAASSISWTDLSEDLQLLPHHNVNKHFNVLFFSQKVAGTFYLFSFFRLRTVVVVGSLYWARSRLQPSTFRIFFPIYLESVPPPGSDACVGCPFGPALSASPLGRSDQASS